jgi:hypothetical protein
VLSSKRATITEVAQMKETPFDKAAVQIIGPSASLETKRQVAIQMIQSGLLPNTLATIDDLEDEDTREKAIGGVIAIVEFGRELNITPWIALNNMHVVQGKVVMGIHMYLGLALQNNIIVDVIEDYKKMVNKDNKPVDYVTTVEVTRKYPQLNNMVKAHRFSKRWTEIVKAGLDQRDNYKKRPILMLRTRCITEALRLYAADVFMGTFETTEYLDVTKDSYSVDDDGNVI